jgi:hypothetical protein
MAGKQKISAENLSRKSLDASGESAERQSSGHPHDRHKTADGV